MKLLLFLPVAFLSIASSSLTTHSTHFIHPNASQFDFWLGDWDLSWGDTSKGTNHISKELNGYVLQENFYDPVTKYTGKSWSLYDSVNAVWKQTWVDNQGAYIALTGKFENGKMILTTAPAYRNGKLTISRMIFYNIQKNSFDWNWEHSTDDGRNWQVNWKIHYQRKQNKNH